MGIERAVHLHDESCDPGDSPLRIVLVERGARGWEHWARSEADGAELVVMGQNTDESPTDFALRVIQKIAGLERHQRFAARGIFAMNEQDANAVSAARLLLARVLVNHLGVRGSGEIVLAADAAAPASMRHELMELTGMAMAQLSARGVAISLRFGQPSAAADAEGDFASGVHPVGIPRATRAVG